MDSIDDFFKEVAVYAFIGALLALPHALLQFPLNFPALLLPACLSYFQTIRLKRAFQTFVPVWIHAIGPYIGLALMFHLIHGSWDYQGVFMGLLGWIFLAPILYMLSPKHAKHRRNQQSAESGAADAAPLA